MRRLPLSTVSMAASSGMQNYHGYMAAMPTLPIERASGHALPQKRALPPLLILTVQSQSSDQCYFIPAEEGVRVPGGGDADGDAAAEKIPA